MKKIYILIPGILTTPTIPMVSLISCGNDGPKPIKDPLCFTDVAGDGINSNVKFNIYNGGLPKIRIQYSFDKNN